MTAFLAIIVATLAAIVLVGGYLLDNARLRTLTDVWSPMAPLTAVLLILLSGALLTFQRRRTLSHLFLFSGFIIAAAVLGQYFSGIDLALDSLTKLFHRGRSPLPELPAPDTSAAVIVMIIALACFRTANKHFHDFGDVVVVLIGIICLQVLVAYIYNVTQASGFIGFRQIAPHTTLSMMLLAMAVTGLRPSPGLYWSMQGDDQSARLLRRLLPVTVFFCVLLGTLHVVASRAHIATLPTIVSWNVVAAIVLLALLLFVGSAEIRKAEGAVREREAQLVASTAAAEAASEAKSRFMAVMSHELRTPLTAMIGYADLIESGVAGPLSKDAQAFTQRIRSSGWHLVGLIDAVLFYAGGKLLVEDESTIRVDVAAFIRETTDMFASDAREKRLELRNELPANPIELATQPRKLQQVLMNLLSNAIKFTEEGNVTVSARREAHCVIIEVRDTGPGIDDEHLAHIWEPFQQIDASHTRVHGGMGLGLAAARHLIDQLGAEITVKSTVGKGSVFAVELPQDESADSASIELNNATVLVVDDELAVRRIMARTLTRYGAHVLEAASAYEALARINETESSVVVTDISMPGMTGIQLAQRLRHQGYTGPILFVTGAELDARDDENITTLGARVLRKPFDMADLARAVLDELRRLG